MSGQIDLYYWPTPNGWKISIALEELGLAYRVIPVDIGAGEQFAPDFLALNPNNKIPVIVDPEGPDGAPITMFDSGAILLYLAEKTGRLLPADSRARCTVVQWLMFQVSGVGPMLGQAHHFRIYAPETIDYAVDRYTQEAGRLYGVLDRRLGEVEYLGGEYSIADIATFPWISRHERQGQDLADYPNVRRWFESIAARPAVIRGMAVLDDRGLPTAMDDTTRANLFGSNQYERR